MKPRARWTRPEAAEFLGIGILAVLAAWFLRDSWRKWADPMIDSGPQWYALWRVSEGDAPYHAFAWYYGPLSLLCNGLVFKCFGPGMMTLAVANLAVYGAIVALAYVAFRIAWGKLAAFAALAVFIAAFSFSLLNTVGNYNYVLPYSGEATHGVLLMLATAFVVVRWINQPARGGAFLLGLCGGLAAVLKPEFMLTACVLGIAAALARFWRRRPPALVEWALILAGVALPTLLISIWLTCAESWPAALVDSCQAWWRVLMDHHGSKVVDEATYMGLDHAWRNFFWEAASALSALLVVGAIWAAGWFLNRPWRPLLRAVAALGAAFLACSVDMGGGFEIGPCLPGLVVAALVLVLMDLKQAPNHNYMALMLVLLAGAMLMRMPLRARINHFGFIQAAFAGMVAAAVIVSKVPQWTGPGIWGRRVTTVGLLAMLAIACGSVAAESARNHAAQTLTIGSGADRFYAFGPDIDETGEVVNWSLDHLKNVPPDATLLVLPEGVMINYLTRHRRPVPEFEGEEVEYVKELGRTPPDYVIVIWGDHRDAGYPRFGDPGQAGEKVMTWLRANYVVKDTRRGRTKWAFFLQRKPPAK